MKKRLPSLFRRKQKESTEERPHYSIWQGLFMCFYSPKFYVDVLQRWKGYGLKYLFVASIVLSLPFSIQKIIDLNAFFDDELIVAFAHMPTLKVEEGKVIFDKPMPYVIKNDEGKPLLVIDTNTGFNDIKKPLSEAAVIVTERAFYINGKRNAPAYLDSQPIQSEKYNNTFPKNFTGYVKGDYFEETVNLLKNKVLFLVIPSVGFTAFLGEALILFALSFMTALFSNILIRYPLKFKQALRLTYVCGTPQQAIAATYAFMKWPVGQVGLVMFAVLLFYFCFAVAANKNRKKTLVTT